MTFELKRTTSHISFFLAEGSRRENAILQFCLAGYYWSLCLRFDLFLVVFMFSFSNLAVFILFWTVSIQGLILRFVIRPLISSTFSFHSLYNSSIYLSKFVMLLGFFLSPRNKKKKKRSKRRPEVNSCFVISFYSWHSVRPCPFRSSTVDSISERDHFCRVL